MKQPARMRSSEDVTSQFYLQAEYLAENKRVVLGLFVYKI